MTEANKPAPVAVILVAGVGQRLRPLTDDRPKALVTVGSETILQRTIRQLLAHGVRELVLATGYCEQAVRDAVATCPVPVTLCRNDRYDSTQNSVSLLRCREAVAGRDFYKLDGDLIFDGRVLGRLDGAGAPLAVAVDSGVELGAEEMKVRVQGDRIAEFGKGLVPSECRGESIGIERVSGVAVSLLFHALGAAEEGGDTQVYYEDIYSRLIAGGLEARALEVGDLKWTEIDTPEDLRRAREMVGGGETVKSVVRTHGGIAPLGIPVAPIRVTQPREQR